jgi:hypothetical protein
MPGRSSSPRIDDHIDAGLDAVPLADAAAALGITVDAARKRIKRGTLLAFKAADSTWMVPRPAVDTEPGQCTAADHDADQSALVARLDAEIAYLHRELDRRALEVDRLHHLLAAALERPALPAGEPAQSAPQSAKNAPQRRDRAEMASEPMKPVSDSLALRWRAWWRRMRGE